jgi:hypothetical protein
MRTKLSVPTLASALLLAICTLLVFAGGAAPAELNKRPQGVAATRVAVSDTYVKLPLSFEPNQGQTDQGG